jgi:hypothetical protein
MCAAGTPACVQRERFKRGTALALEHNRNEIHVRAAQHEDSRSCQRRVARSKRRRGHQQQKPLSSSRFEGGNRPQPLGGAGTRHRMVHGGVAQLVERPLCKQRVAGSMSVTSTMLR